MIYLAESQLAKLRQTGEKAKPSLSAILTNLYQLIEDASFILVPLFTYLTVVGRISTAHLNTGTRYAVTLGCVALGLKFLRYLSTK